MPRVRTREARPPYVTQLPKIFPINHYNRRGSRVKVIKQPRIDADAARDVVPIAIGLKSRAVAVGAAAARGAKMVRHKLALPAVDRITRVGSKVKLLRRVVSVQHAALCAKRAGATGQRCGNVAVDPKSDLAAMAAS